MLYRQGFGEWKGLLYALKNFQKRKDMSGELTSNEAAHEKRNKDTDNFLLV
jgi:hypothetical protein